MATTKIPVELSSTPGIVDNSNATAITIDSSENVGIGTATPAKALQVKTDTNGDGVNIQRNSTTADHYGQLSFSVSTNDSYTTPNVWIRGVRGSSYTNNFMTFGTGGNTGTEAMRIDSSQQVGIGTTSPEFALHVKHATTNVVGKFESGDNQVWIDLHDDGSGAYGALLGHDSDAGNLFMVADASVSTKFIIKDGGNAYFSNNVGIGETSIDANLHITHSNPNIKFEINGQGKWAIGMPASQTYLAFDESNDALTTPTMVMTKTTKRVGIGTTSPGHPLHINSSDTIHLKLSGTATSGTGIYIDNDRTGSKLFGILVGNIAAGAFSIKDEDAGATRFVINSSGSITFNQAYTFPTSDGSASQFLQTDGSGNLSFATVSTSDNTKLPLAGGTMTGNLSSSAQIMTTQESANALKTRFLMGKDSGNTNDGALYINYATSHDVLIGAGGGSSDLIVSGGKVGIGTESPTHKLVVSENSSGLAANFLNSNTSGAGVNIAAASGDNNYAFRVEDYAGNEKVRINGSGKVGIGTSTPGHKVHIYGGSAHTNLVISTADGYKAELRMTEDAAGTTHGGFIRYDGNGDYVRLGTYNAGAESINLSLKDDTKIGTGGITVPQQNFAVGTTTNYDPPGLGSSNANFAILKKDGSTGGNYGIITGVSSDGNVWSQVQRTDGTATGYNYYLQPSGGSVGIGIPQNHTYIPNLIVPFRVGKVRTGTGNDSDYLTKMSIDAIGYAGNNYQFGAIDFTGGDTAGASGNHYARIGCSSMVGTNNQETGSLEFYVKAPSFGMSGTTHAMKITGKADTSSAGGGTTRNGVLFTYQGIAIDRSWSDYPGIAVMNATPYSSTASTQSELRIHGTNISSASYPSTSGSDFSVVTRSDGGYATGSDRRRKKNITTIDNALSTVKQLTGKRFQTVNSADEVQEHVSKNGYKFGFIAQEVEDIIPETVQYHADEDDGTDNYNTAYAMDYGSVVALLVNAIKEQDTTIVALEARIKALEDK